MKSLVWFRRDLRIKDNPALFNATQQSDDIFAIAICSGKQWEAHGDSPAKKAFWHANLESLTSELADLGIKLKLLKTETFAEIPALMVETAKILHIECVFFNKEYEYNEKQRDQQVIRSLNSTGVKVAAFDDRTIVAPGKLLTGSGRHYKVYTPFRRSWLNLIKNSLPAPLPAPKTNFSKLNRPGQTLTNHTGNWRKDLWPAGEKSAHKMLEEFLEKSINQYHVQRDFPEIPGTSMLSPYLAAGVLSPLQCLNLLIEASGKFPDQDTPGEESWLGELIWKDFYTHVLDAFPHVSKSQPFKPETEAIEWIYDEKLFNAWKEGLTGYPIVDAAMRQLKQTGWMHNRLRMVSAMFLSKHLLIDWRQGERFFMQNLIDGDLSANNGGWQWSASTGTDAVPYFRIFNPFSQSKRFDSEGKFIRKFCPELKEISGRALHDAKKLAAEIKETKTDYPPPIVDHAQARKRALEAFKKLK